MVRFSAIERKLLDEALDPEMLADHIPEMSNVVKGAAMLRDLVHETEQLGKFQKKYGFDKDRTMQRIAKIDNNVQAALEDLHKMSCTCSKGKLFGNDGHKAWFYEWLTKHGQAYDVRGKVGS
jgi:hypothetical protein